MTKPLLMLALLATAVFQLSDARPSPQLPLLGSISQGYLGPSGAHTTPTSQLCFASRVTETQLTTTSTYISSYVTQTVTKTSHRRVMSTAFVIETQSLIQERSITQDTTITQTQTVTAERDFTYSLTRQPVTSTEIQIHTFSVPTIYYVDQTQTTTLTDYSPAIHWETASITSKDVIVTTVQQSLPITPPAIFSTQYFTTTQEKTQQVPAVTEVITHTRTVQSTTTSVSLITPPQQTKYDTITIETIQYQDRTITSTYVSTSYAVTTVDIHTTVGIQASTTTTVRSSVTETQLVIHTDQKIGEDYVTRSTTIFSTSTIVVPITATHVSTTVQQFLEVATSTALAQARRIQETVTEIYTQETTAFITTYPTITETITQTASCTAEATQGYRYDEPQKTFAFSLN